MSDMRHTRRHRSTLTLVLLAASILSGCGDDGEEDASSCTAALAVQSDFQALTPVEPTLDGIEQLRVDLEALRSSLREFVDTAAEQFTDESDALASSLDELRSAVRGGEDDAVSDRVVALNSALRSVEASWQALATAVEVEIEGCELE